MTHSIVESVYLTASSTPDQLAVIEEQVTYTYGALWSLVLKTAAALEAFHVKKGQCVMAECEQKADFIALDLACQLTGGVFVPIEQKSAPRRVADIAQEAEAVLFISNHLKTDECRTVTYAQLLDFPEMSQFAFPDGDELAQLLFTTGTTGKSKGVMITHDNNIALAQNISQGGQMRPGNIELVPIPINHAHGLRTVYANLYMGGAVILIDGVMKVRKIFELVKEYHAAALDLTPMAAAALIRLSKGKFSELSGQLDYIEIGAAALTEEIKQKVKETFPGTRLYNTYGSSESGRTCLLDFSQEDLPFCIGMPVPNAEFIIVDDHHQVIQSSKDQTGLIACKGPMNTIGYWKNPELTGQTLRDGYLYTSDEGYIDEAGRIYIIGRVGDVINYKGVKIAPDEIEEAAAKYEGVKDCCCVPKADKNAGQIPRLFLQMKDRHTQDSFDKKAFMTFLGEHLDSSKLPAEIVFTDYIPRTYNGKLQRKKMLEV